MIEVEKVFNEINSPYELLEFMTQNISYGYLGKNGKIYNYSDKDFNERWFDEYLLKRGAAILKTLHGNCWDQVELERYWFKKNGYEIKTIYEMVNLDYDNNYPTHSFLNIQG